MKERERGTDRQRERERERERGGAEQDYLIKVYVYDVSSLP